MIDADAFDAWRENPVTKLLLEACAAKAEQTKTAWMGLSWDQGKPDPLMLADLRARHETWQDIADVKLEWLQDETEEPRKA